MSYIQKLKDLAKRHGGKYNFEMCHISGKDVAKRQKITLVAFVVLKEDDELYYSYGHGEIHEYTSNLHIETEEQAQAVYERTQGKGDGIYRWWQDSRFSETTE